MFGSAIQQHESAIGIRMSPLLNLPPTSHLIPSHFSRLSQSTGCELPVSYSRFPLAIYFTHGNVFQCCSPSSSHTLLPLLCPQVCSLCVCLYCFPAYRFISMICLDSYVCVKYNIFLFLTFFTLCNRL